MEIKAYIDGLKNKAKVVSKKVTNRKKKLSKV